MSFQVFAKTLREIHSEPGASGTLSWGRVASSFCLTLAAVWACHLIFRFHPTTTAALRDLTAPLRDLMEWSLAPYGANKVMTTIQSFGQNPVNR